jgi:deoxyribodipyrimidine photo-lyase
MPSPLQVVWFKRDLRVADHAPLCAAAAAGPVLPLFVFDPRVLAAPDFSAQHLGFVRECLDALAQTLAPLGARLHVTTGATVEVLDRLAHQRAIGGLWSHEETGNAVTYAIDREVALWCRQRGIVWRQFPQNGVVRGLARRDGWARQWEARMQAPVLATPQRLAGHHLVPCRADAAPSIGILPAADKPADALADKSGRQRGGRPAALARLDAFLDGAVQDYRRGMSSPRTAVSACSRLSPYLAWGAVSLKEVVQAARGRAEALRALPAGERPPGALAGLASFEGRLHWHCHFMQKLESEPEIEFRNVNRAYDGLRDERPDAVRLEAWRRGATGYPMVDACLRMLAATGWLNFRMRAMVTSFASYHLWLHWRATGLHLARELLDYEPGIHWSQTQMQSGVTGINTLRIYNPVKQAEDHDPAGLFVRRWVPALDRVPDDFIFRPWLMPRHVQDRVGVRIGRDYPAPIVDAVAAAREARERISTIRRTQAARTEALAVLRAHGSRKPSPRRRRDSAAQRALDL